MIEQDGNSVAFDKLAKIVLDNPSDIVYFVKAGKLQGLISMSDIRRAKERERSCVDINTSFSFLHGFEYMKARKIFLENDRINALPIVDEDCKLLGDYSRWDEDLFDYSLDFLKGNNYTDIALEKFNKVAIVYPSKQDLKKMKRIKVWKDFLQSYNVDVEIVQKEDVIEGINNNDKLLFVNEDEHRGLVCLYKDIFGNKNCDWTKADSLEFMLKNISDNISNIISDTMSESILLNLKEMGVHVLNLQVQTKENTYWKNVFQKIELKFKKMESEKNYDIHEELWKDFYDDEYSVDYAAEVGTQDYPCININTYIQLKDTEGKYYNVTNGERLTTEQPAKYENTIYFFGPSLIVGWRVKDAHTIASKLQEVLNKYDKKIRVVNCGCWGNEFQLMHRICSTDFKQGDIAIIYDRGKSFTEIPSIDLGECLEREKVPARWFLDTPLHPNHKVYKLWAEEIYKHISKDLSDKKSDGEVYKKDEKYSFLITGYVEKYFAGYKKFERVGAIVMNCNPFTNGHRFLIEEACKKVEELIIFVVEEDRSLFSFKERVGMVIEGVKDLKNVKVVPSGDFILSQQTFPEYFLKVESADVSSNADFDINLFATEIAPRLNITYRFVGEEKTDVVTAEYNNAMKRILPKYGIELIEIPRRNKEDGRPISATDVRNILEKGNFDDVKGLVPETTFEILTRSW